MTRQLAQVLFASRFVLLPTLLGRAPVIAALFLFSALAVVRGLAFLFAAAFLLTPTLFRSCPLLFLAALFGFFAKLSLPLSASGLFASELFQVEPEHDLRYGNVCR
jgi:hypothetical protein